MSAAVVWDPVPATTRPSGDSRSTSSRPDLRLVPTGRAIEGPRSPMRLTRFARLLLVGVGLALAIAVVVSVFSGPAASAGIDHTVTVHAGQTLSEVAAHELPQLSVAEGVAQIQLANGLNSAEVSAGEQLAIPSIP